MNEVLKYYWIDYCDSMRSYQSCIDEHPFQFLHKLNDRVNPPVSFRGYTGYQLTNWKLIDCEEYNTWRELHDDN